MFPTMFDERMDILQRIMNQNLDTTRYKENNCPLMLADNLCPILSSMYIIHLFSYYLTYQFIGRYQMICQVIGKLEKCSSAKTKESKHTLQP